LELKDRIKEVRKYLKIGTQEEFSNVTNFPISRIKDLERGKVNSLKPEEAVFLEEKFHFSGWWLLTGIGNMHVNPVAALLQKKMKETKAKVDHEREPVYKVPALTIKASAGEGNNLESIDSFDTWGSINMDKLLFKSISPEKLRAIQVDGYSMAPMLMPDSWVVFEFDRGFEGDGLYIINWRNILMVKKVQLDMSNGLLQIVSVNPDYDSYEVNPDDQSFFKIIGRVVRTII